LRKKPGPDANIFTSKIRKNEKIFHRLKYAPPFFVFCKKYEIKRLYLHFDNCRHGGVAVFCQSGFAIDIIKLYE